MPKPTNGESKQDFLGRCTRELIEQEGRDSKQAFAMCNAYWDESGAKNMEAVKPFILTATLDSLELAKEDDPQFAITAYTGQTIDLGWLGRYVFDLSGIETKSKIPILREHKRDRVVGFGSAYTDAGNFLVSGQFSKSTRDAKEVLALAREGYPWQASVGISPVKVRRLKEDQKATVNGREVSGPVDIWLKSQVGEVSIVTLGADSDTAAIALTENAGPIMLEIEMDREEQTMNLDELKEKHSDVYQQIFDLGAQSINQDEIKQQAIDAERKRVTEILAAGGDPAITQQAIADGLSLNDCYRLFYEAEKMRRVDGLQELAQEAPPSLGGQPPMDDDAKTFDSVVEQKLTSGEAKSRAQAMKLAAIEEPELHKQWIEKINR